MKQSELFRTAVKLAKSGDRSQAQAMLLELVEANPNHELAWLWLSELVEEPEDKIIALENALTINPKRTQTKKRLHRLRQKQAIEAPPATAAPEERFDNPFLATEEESKLEQIDQLFAAGKIDEGRRQLAPFLRCYTNNAAGWWLIVQHADSQANRLKGLDHLLRLNSQHPKVPSILAKIKPTKEEALQVGRLYERLEQWETAVRYYKLALKSPNNADRLLAKKRLPYVEDQVILANIKATSPTATMLRLAIGPTILYTLLTFIQAGLNPLQIPPLLCFGNILFFGGLLLLGGAASNPNHPWITRLQETAVFRNNTQLRLIGIACVLLPILLLLFLTISRLLAFELDLYSMQIPFDAYPRVEMTASSINSL
jgi:tetratricopeptide (TPR) repeat protein